MLTFLIWCVVIAVAVGVGSLIINLVFMSVVGFFVLIGMGISAIYKAVANYINGDEL